MSRCVLVYTSTMGMEAALLGLRVIVAGQTHYRGKGFTDDPSSHEEFFELLSHALEVDLDLSCRVELARRYAHSFFARSMLPFGLVSEPVVNQPRYDFDALSDLLPGKDEILDKIGNGILKQSSFYLDAQP
jgi:capsule polysaccharide export protein KpsC/LpsZ